MNMPKRKNTNSKSAKSQNDAWLKMMYKKTRREFSAADLQKYTEIEEGVPMAQVIADCEEIIRRSKRKRA
jgi:hypothetical protein